MGMKKIFDFFALILCLCLLTTCSSSGPVDNEISVITGQIVSRPDGFVSPIEEIANANKNLQEIEARIPSKKRLNNPTFINYLGWYDVATRLEEEQDSLENELRQNGEIALEAGRSYSFDLESFCVHAGRSRPMSGDGFKLAKMEGKALEWLPEILKKYSLLKISQDEAQNLIWALLNNVRFDELSDKNQKLLLQIFPHAATKFGNRHIENMARSVLDSFIPSEIRDTVDQIANLRESFLNYQNDFNRLSEIMAPTDNRTVAIPVGWLKTSDGYYIQITSKQSYSQIRVDIYVPADGHDEMGRNPSSSPKIIFRPSDWIALPGVGQRLAISNNTIKRNRRRPKINVCEELKKWKPARCQEIGSETREKILTLSDPRNFPKTRYVSPPGKDAKLEDETDCSHFVQEIYKQAGLEFHYSPTSTLSCLKVFQEVSSQDARPGDLVLYSGHVGILSGDGMLISSTIGGRVTRYSTRDPSDKKFKSAITRLPIYSDFGRPKFLKWRCK